MVRVAAGSFTMGALEGEDVMNAWPPRPIRIPRDWWIGRFPVTVGEYRAFAAAEPFRAGEAWRKLGFPQDDWHPVVNVSWTEALAYVEWLSRTTGASYRLPSEAEWEYAARGGKDGQERYWGDDWDDSGRYMPRRDGKGTVSLKSFAPDGANGAGVIGVLGHVWQWTADCWNGNLKAQPSDGGARDSIGDCKLHIMRGGAWNSSPKLVRTAYRGRGPAVYRSNNLGFRVARTN
jgi:formylglycine-generating enzyme required for sulfatase activity